MALDPQKILIDAFWTAAEARTGTGKFAALVTDGNRIKTADPAYANVVASRSLPEEFPCVFAFGIGESPGKVIDTFRTGDAGAPDYGVPMTLTLDIVCAFDFSHDGETTPVEAEIAAAIHSIVPAMRAAGHRWIGSISPRKTRAIKTFGANKVRRTVATWTLSAKCQPKRSALIA